MTKISEEVNSLFNVFLKQRFLRKYKKTINSANNTKKKLTDIIYLILYNVIQSADNSWDIVSKIAQRSGIAGIGLR